MKIYALFVAAFFTLNLSAQVAITTDGSAPNTSALLDVKSSDKGVLIPRMSSAEKNAIAKPAAGLLMYDTTEQTLYMFDGRNWLGFAPLTNLAMQKNVRISDLHGLLWATETSFRCKDNLQF